MSYTIVYSDYNGLPGSESTYDYRSGAEKPILPDVNLYNSFSFTVKSSNINAGVPPTTQEGAGKLDNRYSNNTSYSSRGYRYGTSTQSPSGAYGGIHVARIPTAMRWVDTNGPNGDGICQNEKGDWFSREVLARPDGNGGGVEFIQNPTPSGNTTFTLVTDTMEKQSSATFNVPDWNTLTTKGSYNGAVFCYNEFGYLNDYEGTEYYADSLWEIPEKIDNLFKFIPDQRESTTLTFTIEVDWKVYVSYGIYNANDIGSSNIDKIASSMGYNNLSSQTGTDTHTITHTVLNNNDDWEKILKDILENRQRSQEEQYERYNQTFPEREFDITAATAYVPPEEEGA